MDNDKLKKANESTKGFFNEFRQFIVRGNVVDMAVGVIIGGAFGTIVKSLVDDIIMPVITLLTGGVHFENWFISLDGSHYATLAEAQEAGASTLNLGAFLDTIIYFLIVAFFIFLIVRMLNKLHKKPEPAPAPATKVCPFCRSEIAKEATRCPHCTSVLDKA